MTAQLFTKSTTMGKNIHVVKRGSHWSAVQEKAKRSSGNFRTQKEAVERAKAIAKNNGQEVCIHGVNGKIREKNSYGHDECPPQG